MTSDVVFYRNGSGVEYIDSTARLARVLQGLIAGGAQRIHVHDSALSTRIRFSPTPDGCCPQTLLDAMKQGRVSSRPATEALVDVCHHMFSEVASELVLVGCGRRLRLSGAERRLTLTSESGACLRVRRPWRSLFRGRSNFDLKALRRLFALSPCRIWLNELPLHRSQPVPTGYHELLILATPGEPRFCMRYSHSARPEREGELYRYRLTSSRRPCWRGYCDQSGLTVHPGNHFEHSCLAVIRVSKNAPRVGQPGLLTPVHRGMMLPSVQLEAADGCRVWLAVDVPGSPPVDWLQTRIQGWLERLSVEASSGACERQNWRP